MGWQAKSEQWQRNDDQPDTQQAPEKQPSFDLDAYERDSMAKFAGSGNLKTIFC
ncbi:MAG: hypothetical protein LKF71_02815 [Oscillospiraceae bacterium]|jgi:hypothetical protein|nr:hypothetical protein [Oscillospiraceae bacterium]